MQVAKFTFNMFQENTYILYDETKECVIVDPGCNDDFERNAFSKFISDNGLKPVRLLNTHGHVDHIAGNKYISEKYGLDIECNKADFFLLERSASHGASFGFVIEESPIPKSTEYMKEGSVIKFGNSELEVLFTPGHTPGHVCLHNKESEIVLTGDCLFSQGIGRTDLPGGDYQSLMNSLKEIILGLPDNTTVYCGHGPETKIGIEKQSNPFLV